MLNSQFTTPAFLQLAVYLEERKSKSETRNSANAAWERNAIPPGTASFGI
jgi:hypothetical protein